MTRDLPQQLFERSFPSTDTATREGVIARLCGQDMESCPYPIGDDSQSGEAWLHGWQGTKPLTRRQRQVLTAVSNGVMASGEEIAGIRYAQPRFFGEDGSGASTRAALRLFHRGLLAKVQRPGQQRGLFAFRLTEVGHNAATSTAMLTTIAP